MNLFDSSSMEDIPLEDVDKTSVEYRVFMVYAQRQLSSSKYGQLLEREQKNQKGSLGREDSQGISPACKGKSNQGLPPQDQEYCDRNKIPKKKKFKWKQKLVPSCLRGQVEEGPRKTARDAPNGHATNLKPQMGVGSTYTFSSATQDDAAITLAADRLAEIVNNSRASQGTDFKVLECTDSLEEDGAWSSKPVSDDDSRNVDPEEKIIDTIVAMLRKSGDELEKKMQKEKTFSQGFGELMSYTFFGKVADRFLEEALVVSATDSEDQVQRIKVAFAMEVIARLTAVDSHPMNIVLGFGMKYLKENFSPWIHSQGGWENALGLPDAEEEVE